MVRIVFKPIKALPDKNPFSNFVEAPEGFEFVCTMDSCFCKSVFEKIVASYKELTASSSEVIVKHTFLFVSSSIATLVRNNPELAPDRY